MSNRQYLQIDLVDGCLIPMSPWGIFRLGLRVAYDFGGNAKFRPPGYRVGILIDG